MGKLIKSILGIAAILTLFFSIYSWNENHDARSDALTQLAQRFEYQAESDVLRQMRGELLQYEGQFKSMDKAPTPTRQRWEKLLTDYELQKEKVKGIQNEMIKKK